MLDMVIDRRELKETIGRVLTFAGERRRESELPPVRVGAGARTDDKGH